MTQSRTRIAWSDADDTVASVLDRHEPGDEEDFVVLRHAGFYFAFKRRELANHREQAAPAAQALNLTEAKASPSVSFGARPPSLNKERSAPSSWRYIELDRHGTPFAVVEPHTHVRATGGPITVKALPVEHPAMGAPTEGTSISRFPSIELASPRTPGTEVMITIDLTLAPTATTSDPLRFEGLPDDWRELPVTVRVSSPQLQFADDEDTGTVTVRRDRESKKLRLAATVAPTLAPGAPIEVTAAFHHNDRWCGTAKRSFGDTDGPVTGTVAVHETALAPDLTVHIHRLENEPTRLHWLLVPAARHRQHLVTTQSAEVRLQSDPAVFTRRLFTTASDLGWAEHKELLQGAGKTLWDSTPASFRENYWSMRDKLDAFTIQFVTDDPWIPWELMRPQLKGREPQRLLAQIHPVARALLAYPDRLRPLLPANGTIATMAPDYTKRTSQPKFKPLPDAQDESAGLANKFGATRIPPRTAALLEALEGKRGPIRILHFAGHGTTSDDISASTVVCEDGVVRVPQVRREETVLGERHRTFVIFNACDTGATGELLSGVGGWAEAFVERGFSGFVAPLWAVFDAHARVAIEELFALLLHEDKAKRLPVGEALRTIRTNYGDMSATFLSYVYFGDVNARFA